MPYFIVQSTVLTVVEADAPEQAITIAREDLEHVVSSTSSRSEVYALLGLTSAQVVEAVNTVDDTAVDPEFICHAAAGALLNIAANEFKKADEQLREDLINTGLELLTKTPGS